MQAGPTAAPAVTRASARPEPALLRRHPALAALPRVALTELPTPVAPLVCDAIPSGALYVKRDDCTSPLYGGNKARKLEFVLGAARARGARRLVTTGGIGTHHGLATTIFGATLGMRTTVVVVPQPITPHVRVQLLALVAHGAELVPAGNVAAAAAQVVRVLAIATLRGERPALVPTGGSSAAGDVGFVSAGFELAEQVAAGLVPEPAEIYVPLGSGGTLAGLALGIRLAGLRSRVVGVLVTDILPPSAARLARMANATLALLRRADPTIPDARLAPADFAIDRAELGPGYGTPTRAGEAAAARARDAGLALEPTYTAKCFAAVLARIESGSAPGPLLFWNTVSSVDPLRSARGHPSEADLPPAIRRWLATGTT